SADSGLPDVLERCVRGVRCPGHTVWRIQENPGLWLHTQLHGNGELLPWKSRERTRVERLSRPKSGLLSSEPSHTAAHWWPGPRRGCHVDRQQRSKVIPRRHNCC